MFDILFFGCVLDDLFANLTISTPIDYRINIFLSFHTSRQFQILHYPLKMFRKTKKKRKKNKRDGRFYKADGSANGIELEQTGSPYVSIMASQRRVGSTKHSARPVAEAHHLLNQTTQFQTDFIHAQIKMMSLDIKRKSCCLARWQNPFYLVLPNKYLEKIRLEKRNIYKKTKCWLYSLLSPILRGPSSGGARNQLLFVQYLGGFGTIPRNC